VGRDPRRPELLTEYENFNDQLSMSKHGVREYILRSALSLNPKILDLSAPYDGPSQSGVGTGDRCVEIAGGDSQFEEVIPLSPQQV
jgi:hypothetical protein